MVQNGPNDHFGPNDLIPNWILAFARPQWTKMVHFGPFGSANRTLAIPGTNPACWTISSLPPMPPFNSGKGGSSNF